MNFLLLISMLFTAPGRDTLSSPWPYQHVGKESGLSNSAITSVFMDAYDQIWLGTWDGLNSYDGSSIRVYKPDPFVKGSISNNVVRDFLEDGHRNLWVITHQGLNRYDRATGTFRTYLDVLNDVPLLEYNIRACVAEDSSIMVSLIGKGIFRFSQQEDDFRPVQFSGVEMEWFRSVTALYSSNGLNYFLGSDGMLVSTVKDRALFVRKLDPVAVTASLRKFLTIEDQHYLVLASGRELILYDLGNIERDPVRLRLGDAPLSAVSASASGKSVWVGSDAGQIFRINYRDGRFEAESMNAYFPIFSRAKIKILDIEEAGADLVWVATDGDGVYKFMTRPRAFFSIASGEPRAGDLSHNIVRAVYEDDAGTLYVGTRGGGVNIRKKEGGPIRVINSKSGLSNDAVLALARDQRGNLWIGVDGEGIDMMEGGTGRILHFPRDLENPGDLVFGSVYSVCIDAFNDVWLGTSGYGVVHLKVRKGSGGRYRLEDARQIRHTGTSDPETLKSNIVYSIVEEKPSILWFGTRGGGVYRYNAITRKLEEHIGADISARNSLGNDDVLSLCIDNQEQLWIGTSGGLNRLYLQTKPYKIDRYAQQEGLKHNTVHAIQEDNNHDIWLSTNDGLVRFEREKNLFREFDTNDGLRNIEFTDGASFSSANTGRLFFGGVNGLDIVQPERIATSSYFPRLAMTAFQIRNSTIMPGDQSGVLSNHIDLTESISLNYDQNFISFQFTTLDYWNKRKTDFAYMLENFDKDWNHIGNRQSVTFTNIPPGSYTFKVRYTNEDGFWSPVSRSISVTIAPPFWKSPLAYAAYALLIIGIQVAIVFATRMRMKRKRILAMENFKAVQARELNDYKLQFFTNIAHEFRTPLTLILAPVTALLRKKHGEQDDRQLRTIYNNSLRMQKLVDELMQFRKIESGKEKLELTVFDAVPFANEIVESFQDFASNRDLHIEFYPEQEQFMVCLDKRKLEKILINLVSNAIKYSTPGGTIGLFLKREGDQAVFTVRDEGIGIAREDAGNIFESFYSNTSLPVDNSGFARSTGIGLSLTKSLVQVHRGTITVQSEPGKGSAFTICLPCNREAYPEALETSEILLQGSLEDRVSSEFLSRQEPQPDHLETVQKDARARTNSVLVVDDHAAVTDLLENLLAERYQVFKASNGRKALEVLAREKVDLVVSDVLMPEMDGLELCKAIKEDISTSHIPVILLTARGEIENRIEGLQVGADSYIPKPFHPDHVLVRAEKLIDRLDSLRKRFAGFQEAEGGAFPTGIGDRDDRFFAKVMECINRHMADAEFNADTIADEVGMSKASLYKKIKTVTGLTPHGLIKQCRLRKAAALLRDSGMSVSEVIMETGFNSRSYFYKSFNEAYNCHPRDFMASPGVEDEE